MKFYALLFLFLTVLSAGRAQDFNGGHKTYDHKNGLSDNKITAVIKDKDGYLWISTREGLNRFDGDKFLHFYSRGDSTSLPSNIVSKLELIDSSHIACGTTNGLAIFNTHTQTTKNISFPSYKNWERYGYTVIDMMYRPERKELWVGTGLGLFVIDSNYRIVQSMMCPEKDLGNTGGYFVTRFFYGPNDEVLFISRDQRIYYADFKRKELLLADSLLKGFPINSMVKSGLDCINLRREGHTAVITLSKRDDLNANSYLFEYNARTGKLNQWLIDKAIRNTKDGVELTPDKRLYNAFRLNDSVFIINPYYGNPLLFNTITKSMRPLSEKPLWFSSWPDGAGTCFFRDEHHFWVGTSGELLQFSTYPNAVYPFAELNHEAAKHPETIFINDAVYNEHKLYLIAMSYGLYTYDTLTKKTGAFLPDQKIHRGKNVTQSVIPVDKENVWVLTSYGALNFHVPDGKYSLIDKKGKPAVLDEGNNQSFIDSKGLIWIGVGGGVTCFDRRADSFTTYCNKDRGGTYPLRSVNYITEDHESNLWMTSSSGLVKWIRKESRFEKVELMRGGTDFSKSSIAAFDRLHGLYLAAQGGVVHYDIASGSFESYTIHDGLVSGDVMDIVADSKGNAWIATLKGLNYFDLSKRSFTLYGQEDGLPEDLVACVRLLGENPTKLLLGFTNSVSMFYPEQYITQRSAPVNKLTGITVNKEPVSIYEEGLSLPYYKNSISFSYTGINFDEGEHNQYAYKLEGYDTAWQNVGTLKAASYINLPAGDYVFKVKTANRLGQWNESAATFAFTIRPPFWRTTPFYIAMAVLALIILFLAFYLQRRRIIKREAEKRRLSTIMGELRMKALRSQLNPHFIFNALNSIQYFIMDNNTEEAAKYLSRFAKLFRLVLENSEDSFIPLHKELEWLRHYMDIEALRFNNSFISHISVDESIDIDTTLIPPMLIQPHIENAILHGLLMKKGDGSLTVTISKASEQALKVVIEDNGIGRAAAKQIKEQKHQVHESKGMSIIQRRMEILKSRYNLEATIAFEDLFDKNGNSSGTRVILIIPIPEKEHLSYEL